MLMYFLHKLLILNFLKYHDLQYIPTLDPVKIMLPFETCFKLIMMIWSIKYVFEKFKLLSAVVQAPLLLWII